MTTFKIQAVDKTGTSITDKVNASSYEDAIDLIQRKGLYLTNIKQIKTKTLANTPISGKSKRSLSSITIGRLSDKQINPFTRQLSSLQNADIPIVQSLIMLESQIKTGLLKNIIGEIIFDINGGDTLSIAMSKHPKAFDKIYVNIINAGEISGALNIVLERLALYREKTQRLKRKVISSMTYPATVILASCVILSAIMIFVIPKFTNMFREMDLVLPWLTARLIAVSNFLFTHWYLFFAFPIVAFVFLKSIEKVEKCKLVIDRLKFKIPIFGNLMKKSAISRVTRTLATLISSGVPILEALNNIKDITGNLAISKAVNQVHDCVREGESIANPLRDSKIFETMVVNMVEIGEQTGELDKMLVKIADYYDNEIENIIESLTSMLEPLIVIFLGATIGTIVIALFLPLIKLMNNLGAGI